MTIRLPKSSEKNSEKFGKTKRGWLGVRIQPVTDDIAEAYGLSEPKGALVASVTSNSPSSKSGIKPGDIILEFDGKEIRKSRDLPRFVASTKIGKKVQVVVWRSNKSRSFNVILGELESFEKIDKAQVIKNKRNKIESLGLQLNNITSAIRAQFNIPKDVNGVIILKVDRGSLAEKRGLKSGDVILAIVNNDAVRTHQKVLTPIEVINAVKKAKNSGKNILLLYVHHLNSSPGYVPLKITDK